MKRAKNIKELDEDNRKLRSLLKVHIENSEKLRVETQTTVETLREEFDLLVKVRTPNPPLFSRTLNPCRN